MCGMLSGAGLSRLWPHDRAHWFFSRARWSPDDLGLAAAKLVVSLLVPAGEPVLVAIDDTLFRRRGKKVWAASWFHDGSARGIHKTGRGNNWAVLAVIVRLPFCSRPVALPVMAKLVVKGTNSASRLWLARRMTQKLAGRAARPGPACRRRFRLRRGRTEETGAGRSPGRPGCARTPPCTGCRRSVPGSGAGPATEGTGCRRWKASPPQRCSRRSPSPLRQDRHRAGAAVSCLWYSVFGTRPVHVILIRDRSTSGYDLALVTTDLGVGLAPVIERYAARWSIEVAIEDAKQVFGAGQARNRTAGAVSRTLPFQLACQAIAVTWYATAGHDPADVEDRRARAPWYRSKTRPSTADMTAKLRRVLITARFGHLALTSRHPKKSRPSAWPGKPQRHNCESRDGDTGPVIVGAP